MKRLRKTAETAAMLLLSAILLPSCNDMDEYFETPDWIQGSIYQQLSDDGQYSQFVKGAEKAGFKTILDGKSILTVMAPNDDAMNAYLQANYGTQDINQLSEAELKKLIGFHILYYSFDRSRLSNFRPKEGDGATEEEVNKYPGFYYKFRTHSKDATEMLNSDTAVYHFDRLLPVFSHRMFESRGIDAKSNYEYFFPSTGWNGDGGFNIANANVTEYAGLNGSGDRSGTASNGYIYKVDRVLQPLETIYQVMKKSGKYDKFLALYDQSAYYEYDENLTIEEESPVKLYHHYHNAPLANIDCEWAVTNYKNIADMSIRSYNIFAPTDDALDNFFNDYWKEGGYASLDEVDSLSKVDLILNCVSSGRTDDSRDPGTIVFPDDIRKGLILNGSGEPLSFDPDKVKQEDRVICTNGVLYGSSLLTPPAKFNAVTGPAYQYKKYSYFLDMLKSSQMVNTLTSKSVKHIILYPEDQQIETYAGIKRKGTTLVDGNDKNISSSAKTAYVYAHVAMPADGDTKLPTTGVKVYPTISPDMKLYWYVKNGKITNCIKHNELLKYSGNTTTEDDVFATFTALDYRGDADGWNNGHTYSYNKNFLEGNFANAIVSKLHTLMWNNHTDITNEFFGFINLLDKAGVFNRSSFAVNFDGRQIESSMVFIPVTQAVEKAIIDGRIPGITAGTATLGSPTFFDEVTVTDKDALAYYLRQYYIPMSTAVVSNYPFVGWGEDTAANGGLITYQQEQTENADGQISITSTNMNIYDTGNSLQVAIIDRTTGQDKTRINVSASYDYLPFVFDDCAAHFIEDVF